MTWVTTLRRIDDRPLATGNGAILAFAAVRNEALRLPYFLDYHRALGVDRLFIADNGSDDGTRDLLLARDDVHVFEATGSYAASNYGMDWMNALLGAFAENHWALTLDADELLVYPHCETVGLHDFVRYLEMESTDSLKGFLLDMYSGGAVRETIYRQGTPFLETCPYFDSDSYREVGRDGIPVRGGPRHRLFWEGRGLPKPSPVLKKTPLVKWRNGLHYKASTHAIDGLHPSAVTGALLHFKFFSDFAPRAEEEAARGEHWEEGRQYKSYDAVLREQPQLTAWHEGSSRFAGSLDLVRLGLARLPDDYAEFAAKVTAA
jgi:Glycosyl transferase family 2